MRQRLTLLRLKHIFVIHTPVRQQLLLQLRRNGHIPVGGFRFQATVLCGGAGVIQVALDVHLILIKVEVTPFESQSLAATQSKVITEPPETTLLDGSQ